MAVGDFEVSALNLGGRVRLLEAQGLLGDVRAACREETRVHIDAPSRFKWLPGAALIDLSESVIRLYGAPRFEELEYQLTAKAFGPVVRPVLRVAMALGGATPASLLGRFDDVVKVALRGVKVTWAPGGPREGSVSVEYPCMVPPAVIEPGWRGVMRFSDDLTGTPLHVGRMEVQPGERRFTYPVSW